MPQLLNGQNFLSWNYPDTDYVFLAHTEKEHRKLYPHFTLQEYELILYMPINDGESEFYIIRQPEINQYFESKTEFLNNILVFYLGNNPSPYIHQTFLHTKTNVSYMKKWLLSMHQPLVFSTNAAQPQPCADWTHETAKLTSQQKHQLHFVSMFMHTEDYEQTVAEVEKTQQQIGYKPVIDVEEATYLCLNSLEKGQIMYLIFPYKPTISHEELIKNLKTTTDKNAIDSYAQMLIGVTGKVQVAKVIKEYRAPKDIPLGEYELNTDGEFVPV